MILLHHNKERESQFKKCHGRTMMDSDESDKDTDAKMNAQNVPPVEFRSCVNNDLLQNLLVIITDKSER